MRRTRILTALLFLITCAAQETARATRKLRTAPEYKVIEGSEGSLRQATLYAEEVPALSAAIEIRSIVVLSKKSLLPTERETLYEVLTGQLISETGGERKTHNVGDLWMVNRGERVTLQAKGEVAVLRAIALAVP